MAEWFYSSAGERVGPVSAEQLQAAADAGRLLPNDSVWTDGWPDWRPATAANLRFSPTMSQVAYFASAELPPRVARTLAGYAPPTGDTGQWPLDESHLIALAEAGRHRIQVRRASAMCRTLGVFGILFVILLAAMAVFGVSGRSTPVAGFLLLAGFTLAATVLFGVAARATRLNRTWGGWVAIAVLLLAVGFCGLLIVGVTYSRAAGAGSAQVMCGFGIVVSLLSIVTAARGIAAIKRFRASPAWCQEAIILGEQRRQAKNV